MGNGVSCGPDCSEKSAIAAARAVPNPDPVCAARRPPHNLIPYRPLHRLSAVGSIRGVAQLLEQGQAGVNEIDQHGRSAMHFAAARGDIAMIQVLLQYGGKFEVADEDGKTPLSIAAQRCEGDVVRYLLAMQRAAQHNRSSSEAMVSTSMQESTEMHTLRSRNSSSTHDTEQLSPSKDMFEQQRQHLLVLQHQQLQLLERTKQRAGTPLHATRSSPPGGGLPYRSAPCGFDATGSSGGCRMYMSTPSLPPARDKSEQALAQHYPHSGAQSIHQM